MIGPARSFKNISVMLRIHTNKHNAKYLNGVLIEIVINLKLFDQPILKYWEDELLQKNKNPIKVNRKNKFKIIHKFKMNILSINF